MRKEVTIVNGYFGDMFLQCSNICLLAYGLIRIYFPRDDCGEVFYRLYVILGGKEMRKKSL